MPDIVLFVVIPLLMLGLIVLNGMVMKRWERKRRADLKVLAGLLGLGPDGQNTTAHCQADQI